MKGHGVDCACCPPWAAGSYRTICTCLPLERTKGPPCACRRCFPERALTPAVCGQSRRVVAVAWPDWRRAEHAADGMAFLCFREAQSLAAVMIRDPVPGGASLLRACVRAWRAVPPSGFPQSMTLQSGRVRRKDNGLPAPFAACGGSRVDRSPPVSFRLFPRLVSFSVVRKTKERRNEP